MQKSLIVFLLVCAALAYREHEATANLEQLRVALAAETKLVAEQDLHMQHDCAAQALIEFRRENLPNSSVISDHFTNHYNASLNKCLMVPQTTMVMGTTPSTAKVLYDAFEGKDYGNYMWINSQGKQFWEVAPTECSVTNPSGREHKCASSEEFDNLAKQYMQ